MSDDAPASPTMLERAQRQRELAAQAKTPAARDECLRLARVYEDAAQKQTQGDLLEGGAA